MVTDFFAQLFISICERIKAEVPAVLWIDRDFGQLEHYSDRPAVEFPCVLIDFPNSTFKDEGENVQWADVLVQFRLAFAPYSSTSAATPVQWQEEALKYFSIESDLYRAFQGWEPDYDNASIAQPFSRVMSASEIREDTYVVRSSHYATAGEDAAAQVVRNRVSAKLNIQQG